MPPVSRKCFAGRLEVGLSPQNHPLKSEKIGVIKLSFIYVRRAKVNNNVISYLGVPRVRSDQCKQLWGFTPDSNSKRGNTKKGNLKDINLFKNAKAKKNSVIAYLIVFSE